MQRRRDGADGEAELEPQRDVDQDAAQREDRRQDPLLLQLLADDRTDDLGPDDLEVADVRRLQSGDDGVGVLTQVLTALRRGLRDANHHHVLRGLAVLLHDGVVADAVRHRGDRGADALDRGRLLELDDDDAAAGEVDAEGQAFGPDRGRAGQDDQERQARWRASATGRSRSWVVRRICMM